MQLASFGSWLQAHSSWPIIILSVRPSFTKSFIHLMQNPQALQGQEGFYYVHLVGFAGHEFAEAAGGDDEGLAAQFLLHPRNDAVHLAYEAEDDTALHGPYRIPADGLAGFYQFDPGQLGGFLEQGFRRNADARGNGTAQVFCILRQGTERGGRTEVDDDQVAFITVFLMGCHGIDDAVRTNLVRVIVIQFQTRIDLRRHYEGDDAEVAAAHVAQGYQKRRYYSGDDDAVDVFRIQAAVVEHAGQEDTEFVGCPVPVAANPPMGQPVLSIMHTCYNIRVAYVHYH